MGFLSIAHTEPTQIYKDMKKDYKNYDLSPLNEYFNHGATPMQLDNEINELMYNYASCVNDADECFSRDVSTLYCLHRILIQIAQKAGETDIL